MKNLRSTVFFEAFLHNIGKAIQRGDSCVKGSHSVIGELFFKSGEKLLKKLEKVTGNNHELLKNIIAHHHEGKWVFDSARIENIENKEYQSFCRIVSRADNFSSQERGENQEKSKSWKEWIQTPVSSVFGDIELSGSLEKKYKKFSFSPLFLNKKNFFPKDKVSGNSETSFEKVFNALVENSNDDFEGFFNALYILSSHYFWSLPANTSEANPTISLFDHLKTTSAIALCSFDYHTEKGTLQNDECIKKSDDEKQFRLLCVDFSGIQNYIFSIEKETFGAKRLRARSFFVEMLLEEVKQMVLEKFDLYATNVLFQAGGKFFVLLPNISTTQNKIDEIQNKIDEISFKKFNAEISLNMGLSDGFSGKEMKNFSDILMQTAQNLNDAKHSPFSSVLSKKNEEENFVIDAHFESNTLCPLCRKFPANTKKEELECCTLCEQDIEIGEKLKNSQNHFLNFYNAQNTIKGSFQLFEKTFSIDAKMDVNADFVVAYNVYTDEIFKNISTDIFSKKFDIRNFANHIPTKEHNEPLDFGEIAQKSEGKKMLGVLKGDIDNLGQIFAVGLEREDPEKSLNSPSRQATLSRHLDLFFSGYLNEFVKEKFSNCYIVYSGGDDFLILGPWTDILELAKEIQKEFEEFVGNPKVEVSQKERSEITLSAGIAFCKPKFPIAKAILQADEALQKAKNSGKNRLCAFDSIIEWEYLNALWKEKKELFGWTNGENPSASVGFVRNLLEYGQMKKQFKEKNDTTFLRWQPMLAYQIARNLIGSNKENVKKWAEEILQDKGVLQDGNRLFFVACFVLYLIRE